MSRKSDPTTVTVIELCRVLGFVSSELSGGVVVELPTWNEFKRTLPAEGAHTQIDGFRTVTKFFDSRIRMPDIRRRWKVWHTGTVRIDNHVSNFPLHRNA
jgi:hypothetical protein